MTSVTGQRPLPVQRDRFDVPDDVAYFNVASLAPTLRSGLAAGHAALRRRAQPWRLRSQDWFDDDVARLLTALDQALPT